MISLYETQKNFLEKIKEEYPNNNYIEKIKDYCLGINRNVSDVLETLDWDPSKEPKSNSKLHQKIETKDAAVDIIKYALNLCIEYDVDIDDLQSHFEMKHRTVEQKLHQKKFLKSEKFRDSQYAFIIDIDGVIADIVTSYKWFFCRKLKMNQNVFKHFKAFDTWRTKNIDLYKRLKEEYRLSGCKMHMPLVEGTKELLSFCHEKGIVSLLSNRPVKSYPIIYMYTVEWLIKRDLLRFIDMIHFTDLGEKRYFFDRFNKKQVFFLEDNYINLIDPKERHNVRNIFIGNETNEHLLKDDGLLGYYDQIKSRAEIVNSLNEAVDFIKKETDEKKML